MEKSDSIVALTKALIKAQGELESVLKDTQAYNYKYATLPAVFEEYKKHFLQHGLVVIQSVEGNGLRTTLSHESGEWVSSLASLMPIKNDPQAQGSAITYMRRYALAAICGIMAEDDDGQKAMPASPKSEHKPETKPGHEAAKLQPSEKKVRGTITDHKESGIFHNYTVNGLDLSTKQAKIIEDMNLYYEGKDNLEIIYNEVPWAKGVNRYISAVKPLGDGEIPF